MKLIVEIILFILYTMGIILISKYILVKTLRHLADNLKLKSKVVGNIAGVATSVPELLTICASSFKGLKSASIYNVLSSNLINLIQYFCSIFFNKNQYILKNKSIKIELYLAILTIIIPIIFIVSKTEFKIDIVPILIILYIILKKIDKKVHKKLLKYEEEKILKNSKENINKKMVIKDVIILFFSGVLLFIIGDLLGNTLEKLCTIFNISQIIIGIVLGFITSIPELITFFESQRHHSQKENDILGVVETTNNLLTSNMMNLFIIQSIGIIVYEILYG